MYTMKEVCQIVGWSYETLKYYCKEGLIPNVKRDKNNYRVFDENNIEIPYPQMDVHVLSKQNKII